MLSCDTFIRSSHTCFNICLYICLGDKLIKLLNKILSMLIKILPFTHLFKYENDSMLALPVREYERNLVSKYVQIPSKMLRKVTFNFFNNNDELKNYLYIEMHSFGYHYVGVYECLLSNDNGNRHKTQKCYEFEFKSRFTNGWEFSLKHFSY